MQRKPTKCCFTISKQKFRYLLVPASALALASARAMFQFRASAKEDYPQECAEYEAMREERVSSGDFVVCVFC